MRTAGTLLAASSALVALAATGAYATTEAKTTTPCKAKGSTAWAKFKAGSTTTWKLRQHAADGSYETDSDFGYAAVTAGQTYRVEVTDPNYVTLSVSVIDDTSTVSAAGSGHCDRPDTSAITDESLPHDLVPDGIVPDNVFSGLHGPVAVPVVLPDTLEIHE